MNTSDRDVLERWLDGASKGIAIAVAVMAIALFSVHAARRFDSARTAQPDVVAEAAR